MTFYQCTSNLVPQEDGSAIVTTTLCPVSYKCMQSAAKDPNFWINNAIDNRVRIEGENIYKKELDRHLTDGTLPSNVTKQSLILSYEIPVVDESNIITN